MRRLLLALLLLPLSCGGPSGHDEGHDEEPAATNPPPSNPPPPNPPPAGSGSTTTKPTVPPASAPPVGVTWHIGITENVSLASMQSLFASLVAASNALWSVSEGQVRVHKLVFFDAVGAGVTAQQFTQGGGALNTSNLDILVFPGASWDVPASGAVGAQPGMGRNGRIMIIPASAPTFVLLHEASHLLFQLSWSAGPLLIDEYQDGVQDTACVMESENLPQRWCSDPNHRSQSSQPHSCWRQILADYPLFAHSGADSAPGLPAAPVAEYNDTP